MASRSNQWKWACGIAGLMCLARIALQPFAGATWQPSSTDGIGLLRTMTVIAALMWAARRMSTTGQAARPWYAFAAAFSCLLIADTTWAWLDWHGNQPWGSAADFFFLSAYPCFLFGIYSLPRTFNRPTGRGSTILDALVIALAAGAALWTLAVEPKIHASQTITDFEIFLSVAYPLGDLIVVWAIMDLSFRGQVHVARGVSELLTAGFGLLVITDFQYSHHILNDTYFNGNYLGILWCISACLIGLAAVRQATHPLPDRPTGWVPLMSAPILAAIALIGIWALAYTHPESQVAHGAGIVCAVLVLVRQVQALNANRDLEEQLHQLNKELEQRVRDRTKELITTQQRLSVAERLEAVGRVAGAVAHDFNNILTAVSGHTELAKIRNENPAIHKHLETILSAIQRATDLAKRLIATSRPAEIDKKRVAVGELLQEVADHITASLANNTTLKLDIPDEPVSIDANSDHLHQMLMNMCTNARDAMPNGGTLSLQLTANPTHAIISITDTGIGMDDQVRSQLFEPYFTTKPKDRGNGLGLATVRAVVLQHQGSIDLQTALGCGSTFRFTFPISTAAS